LFKHETNKHYNEKSQLKQATEKMHETMGKFIACYTNRTCIPDNSDSGTALRRW